MRAGNAAEDAMKRWETVLAIVGLILLYLGARSIRDDALLVTEQRIVLDEGSCRTPMTVVEPVIVKVRGTAVVLHGLSANRRLMSYLGKQIAKAGLRVYLLDLPGHGDNTDPFTFARAQECATVAVESLTQSGKMDPKRTILVGHSMGAAIAIRMADRDPVAATIAISPAPMITPQRMPGNLLIFSAGSDLGLLKRRAERLARAAGGNRTQPEDFAQERAFELQYVHHATHTSLLFDPRVSRESIGWVNGTLNQEHRLGGDEVGRSLMPEPAASFPSVYGSVLGLCGLVLLFPLCVTITTKFAGPVRAELPGKQPTHTLALAEGAVCALVGVLILTLVTPLKFIHMYTGDYLASLLLIAGVLLLILNWQYAKENWSLNQKRFIAAAVLGLATILAFGAWLNWQLDDAWLNAPRWLRFAGLLPVAWIFCFAEEAVLGPVHEGRRRTLRFAIFLGLRLELWLACALAFYKLASGQVLILLLFTFLALFSVLQRLATDALRQRTGSPTAAALFGAILAAWFIAAVFPLT